MLTKWFTQEHFFTPETYGDIIYEHFLFDIPKLLDLCVLYGGANKALLGKMVGNVFERQPKYQDDLQTCIQSILMVSVRWDTMTLIDSELHRVTLRVTQLHWVTLSYTVTLSYSYIELQLHWVTLSYSYIELQLHWVTVTLSYTTTLSYIELHSYI